VPERLVPDPRAPDPMRPQFDQAVALHQQGRLAEAETIYTCIIGVNPVHFDALHMLGIVCFQMGRLEAGIGFVAQAIKIAPNIAEPHSNLANALIMLRRFDEALAECERAIKLNPKLADAWNNRAIALQELGRFEDALHSSDRAIRLSPNNPQIHNIRAVALRELGRRDQALASYDKAIALNAALPHIHYNRANLLRDMNRQEEALVSYDAAIRLKSDLAEVHNARAVVLLNLARPDEALDAARRALALRPNLADAYNNLGNIYSSRNLLVEARKNYAQALSLDPNLALARNNLSNVQRRLGLIDEAIVEHERALALNPNDAEAHRNLLLTLTYHPTLDLERYFAEHRRFEDRFARPHYAAIQPHTNKPDPGRRLRIGYMSSDLRAHTVARSILPIVRDYTRTEFELYFYAEVAAPDVITDEFKSHATGWRSTIGLADEAVAAQMRKDGIDILVCLAGRFDRNRPLVCAYKPAPILVSFHDVATSGLTVMDYLISDRVLTPRRTAERFTERLLCLPAFYLAEPPKDLPPLTQRDNSSIVFGCLNNPAKVSTEVLDLWGRVMAAVPQSRLLLRYFNAYEAAALRARVHAALAHHGVDADRVQYPIAEGPHAKSLEQYAEIDIALDTFPFSGSTTTFDALIMGVPVVTLPGKTMVSRWSAGMLTSLGRTDLIATDADNYVAIAQRLAADQGRRAALRETLRARVLHSPLTDHVRKTRYLERFYRAIWRRWCAAQRNAN
jgi:protein O-GlcNAc transferase